MKNCSDKNHGCCFGAKTQYIYRYVRKVIKLLRIEYRPQSTSVFKKNKEKLSKNQHHQSMVK